MDFKGFKMFANARRSFVTFLITFLIGLVVFGILALILVPKINNLLDFGNPNTVINDDENGSALIDPSSRTLSGSSFTVLLVGTDEQQGVTTGTKVSADTIILVTVSEAKESFVYMPIPSRTEVTVDGDTVFLGNTYGEKGIDYLCEKVMGLTGITINKYAVVDLSGMSGIIDKLGGINYNVPVNMRYEDKSQDLEIDISRGSQKLDGEDAVKMLRYRSDSFKDRSARNLSFLQTAVRLCLTIYSREDAADAYAKLSQYATTNLDQSTFLEHADTFWSYGDFKEVSLELPGRYTTNSDGYTIYKPDTVKAFEMLSEYKN